MNANPFQLRCSYIQIVKKYSMRNQKRFFGKLLLVNHRHHRHYHYKFYPETTSTLNPHYQSLPPPRTRQHSLQDLVLNFLLLLISTQGFNKFQIFLFIGVYSGYEGERRQYPLYNSYINSILHNQLTRLFGIYNLQTSSFLSISIAT